MSLVGWLTEQRSQMMDISSPQKPANWMMSYFGGNASKSGVKVDTSVVMTVSAFYRGISIRTNALAMMPMDVRMQQGRGSRSAENHWSQDLISGGFDPDIINFNWLKLMEHNRIIAGNAYALRVYDAADKTLALHPIHPSRIRAARTDAGKLFYLLRDKTGHEEPLLAKEVFHIAGSYSEDGISGRPLVDLMRESVGVSLAMQEHGARLFSNGARMSGFLKHPTRFSSTEVANRVRQSFEQANSGLSNAHRTALLEEGMDWVSASLSAVETQFLEGRKFEVTEAARWLELPPHMIADLEKSSFNNIEQQGQEFKTHTMQPSVTLWEQMFNMRLLRDSERKKYFFKFNMNALVRADLIARTQYYQAGRNWGWLCADDIAELEDMNPLPDGKGQIYLQPLNMIKAGEDPPEPAPAAVPGADPLKAPDGKDPANDEAKQGTAKKKTGRAFERLITAEMASIQAKEANILRNLVKKSAKNTNFADFKKEFDEFTQRTKTSVEKDMGLIVQSFAEVQSLSVVDALNVLAKFSQEHSERLKSKCLDDPLRAFEALNGYCDYLLGEDADEAARLITKLGDVK